MRSPRRFFEPLAVGAPTPLREIPVGPMRVIHFFPPQVEKVRNKIPTLVGTTDIILGNLEDSIEIGDKEAARQGLIEVGKTVDFGDSQFWARVNGLDTAWFSDDIERLVGEIGDKLDVIMLPKVEGEEDIHFLDRRLA